LTENIGRILLQKQGFFLAGLVRTPAVEQSCAEKIFSILVTWGRYITC